MSGATRKIEKLEASVESAQTVLDHAQRALSAIDTAQEHAEGTATTLRRIAVLLACAGAIVVGVILLRRRSA